MFQNKMYSNNRLYLKNVKIIVLFISKIISAKQKIRRYCKLKKLLII